MVRCIVQMRENGHMLTEVTWHGVFSSGKADCSQQNNVWAVRFVAARLASSCCSSGEDQSVWSSSSCSFVWGCCEEESRQRQVGLTVSSPVQSLLWGVTTIHIVLQNQIDHSLETSNTAVGPLVDLNGLVIDRDFDWGHLEQCLRLELEERLTDGKRIERPNVTTVRGCE